MSRYIDADTLKIPSEEMVAKMIINSAPHIDIVRCRECKHCYVNGEQVKFNACELNHNKVQSDDWFCADGERKE